MRLSTTVHARSRAWTTRPTAANLVRLYLEETFVSCIPAFNRRPVVSPLLCLPCRHGEKKSLSPHPVHESTGAVSQAMRAKAPVETRSMQTYLASATGQNSTPTDRVTCSNTNRGLMCTRAHQGVLRMLIARRITPKANPKRCVIHLWP